MAISAISASKAWNLAGLKCAALITASPTMAAVVERLPPDTAWRVGHFGLIAAVAAFDHGEQWLDRLLLTLDRRRTQLAAAVAERLPGLRWHPPRASFLAWLDCSALGGGDQARQTFLERGRVALQPGSRFGTTGADHVRLNFSTSAENLDQPITAMTTAMSA